MVPTQPDGRAERAAERAAHLLAQPDPDTTAADVAGAADPPLRYVLIDDDGAVEDVVDAATEVGEFVTAMVRAGVDFDVQTTQYRCRECGEGTAHNAPHALKCPLADPEDSLVTANVLRPLSKQLARIKEAEDRYESTDGASEHTLSTTAADAEVCATDGLPWPCAEAGPPALATHEVLERAHALIDEYRRLVALLNPRDVDSDEGHTIGVTVAGMDLHITDDGAHLIVEANDEEAHAGRKTYFQSWDGISWGHPADKEI